jgi:ferritin-like protein
VILAEEVLPQEHRYQVLFAASLGKDKLLKQLTDTLIVDEVCTETQLLELAIGVSQNSLSDCSEASNSDSVMTEVNELQS